MRAQKKPSQSSHTLLFIWVPWTKGVYARLLSIWSVIAAPRAAPRAARKLDIWLDYEYVQSLLRQQAVQEQENLTFSNSSVTETSTIELTPGRS